MAAAPPFRKDDSVITPTGGHAIVMAVQGNFLLLRYVDPLPGVERELELHARLVSKYVPGLFRPIPVRIDDDGRVVKQTTANRRRSFSSGVVRTRTRAGATE